MTTLINWSVITPSKSPTMKVTCRVFTRQSRRSFENNPSRNPGSESRVDWASRFFSQRCEIYPIPANQGRKVLMKRAIYTKTSKPLCMPIKPTTLIFNFASGERSTIYSQSVTRRDEPNGSIWGSWPSGSNTAWKRALRNSVNK